jgi:heptaprenyl diphosphate synthase
MKDAKTKKIALLGMFCALSVAISFIETLIPPIVPVPGVKPGFSNIVTMFATVSLGFPYGLAVTLFKSMFALITRGITAFMMSLCGGLLSLVIMWMLFRFTKKSIGYIGIGVLSAVSHNMGQLIVAVVILGKAILYIAPILMLSGIVCGALTGTIFRYVYPLLHRHTNKLSNHFTND